MILQRIIENTAEELRQRQQRLPLATLRRLAEPSPTPLAFIDALSGGSRGIIAEVKRASPSRGLLRRDQGTTAWQPDGLAEAYGRGGARCLSVLTDARFFLANPEDLARCKARAALPTLRKDFVLDPYHVVEARWLGADAVLLMLSVLDAGTLRECLSEVRAQGMAALVEVHDDHEVQSALALRQEVGPDAWLLGVNHRNLRTMAMDPDRALRVRDGLAPEIDLVAESGISGPEDIRRLTEGGIHRFLVGSALAAAQDPAAALAGLIAA